MFRCKGVASKKDKTLGFFLRFFGLDLSALLIWSLPDLRLIDLRIPCNRGIFLQLGCLVLSIGRFPNDEVYRDERA